MITDSFIAERERIEHEAAMAAYRAGLGASEWQAFVSKGDWETYFALGASLVPPSQEGSEGSP